MHWWEKDDYDSPEWDTDESSSMLSREKRVYSRLGERRGGSIFDSFGRFGFGGYFRDDPDKKAQNAVKIQKFVHNLCRIHGAPNPFTVKFDLGTKTASVTMPPGAAPVISLGADALEDDDLKMADLLEIYGGFGIHETQHILSTGRDYDGYVEDAMCKLEKAKHEGDVAGIVRNSFMRAMLNLVEDVRIERIAVKKSPGFDQYLWRVREYVFGKSMKKIIADWPTMSDRSRFMSMVTVAFRAPHLVTEEMVKWTAGEFLPFEFISAIPSKLESAKDVYNTAKAIVDVYMALTDPEAEKSLEDSLKEMSSSLESMKLPHGSPSGASEKDDGTETESGEASSDGDGESEGDGKKRKDGKKKDTDKAEDRHEDLKKDAEAADLADRIEKLRERIAGMGVGGHDEEKKAEEKVEEIEAAKKPMSELESAVKALEKMAEEAVESGKMGLSTLLEMMGKATGTMMAMSSDTAKSLEKLVDEKFDGTGISGDGLMSGRELGVKQPRLDDCAKARFHAAERVVKKYVDAASSIFHLRKAVDIRRSVDRLVGKLHRKRLALAETTDRLFYRDTKYMAKGVSICLLLDESGSMGYVSLGERTRGDESCMLYADQALAMAVMLQLALEKVPRIDLHAYSHESYGPSEENCMVKHLHGGERNDREGLGCYYSGNQNYDHVAIATVGNRFKEQAKYEKRVLFYLADGEPCGYHYGGGSAVNAVKKVVQKLEREGMTVICLGVGGHNPSRMFKNSVAFNGDFRDLLAKVKKIISKEVLGAGADLG